MLKLLFLSAYLLCISTTLAVDLENNLFHQTYLRAVALNVSITHSLEQHLNNILMTATFQSFLQASSASIKEELLKHCLIQHKHKLKQEHNKIAQISHTKLDLINPQHLRSNHPLLRDQGSNHALSLHQKVTPYYTQSIYDQLDRNSLIKKNHHEHLAVYMRHNLEQLKHIKQISKNGMHLLTSKDNYITAQKSGTVTGVHYISGYGYHIILQHPDNSTSLYGKITDALVSVGEKITAGMHIGTHNNYYQKMLIHAHHGR